LPQADIRRHIVCQQSQPAGAAVCRATAGQHRKWV